MKQCLVACALAALCACSSEAPSGSVQSTDSAGVAIHEIPDEIRLSSRRLPDPAWTVGGMSAGPDAEFFGVEGAVVLDDGSVVIANSGVQELKRFDRSGEHLRTVGGEGEGPGEFKGIDLIGRIAGDSVLTFDWRQNRFQLFDRELELGRVTVIAVPEDLGPAGVNPIAVLPDGSFLARGAELVREYPREPLQRHIFLMDATGQVVDSLGPFAGGRRIWMSGEPWPPFERSAGFAVHDSSIYSAISESSELRRHSLSGDLIEIVRGGLSSRPPTSGEIELASRGLPPTGSGSPWISDSLPYWTEFFVDDLGATWRSRHRAPDAPEAEWLIVESGGADAWLLVTPAPFTPLSADARGVLAVLRDDLDVETVAYFPFAR